MKFAKSAGGFSGIFHMFGAYEIWCRTKSTRAQYHEKLLEMFVLVSNLDCPMKRKHRELEKTEIEISEKAVTRFATAIKNFTDPFEVADKRKLYNLASGTPLPLDMENDVMQKKIKENNQKDD